jgi:predicted Ser/Thr protein kinase
MDQFFGFEDQIESFISNPKKAKKKKEKKKEELR